MRDMVVFLISLLPVVGPILKSTTFPMVKPEETKFFAAVIRDTLKHRSETKTRRNDLVDLMLDALQESGNGTQSYEEDLSIVSTAIVFLMAGYDTTTLTMTHLVYRMALNPTVQEQLIAEIDDVLSGLPSGETFPDYKTLQEMEYLDACISETLRMHPIVESATRDCTSDYKLKGCDLVIEKGTMIDIPTIFIHKNPDIFPEPEKFEPARFLKENITKRQKMAFLGFGKGPRNCIGGRFALIEMKIGIISLFSKHLFEPCERTPKEIVIHPTAVLAVPNHDMFVRAIPR